MKREPESLIVAAKNQSRRTNLVKAKIKKSQKDTLCRLCKKADESMEIYIMLQGCSRLAQKEYKRRHDNFKMYNSKIVHWKLARKCNFEAGNK